jgi:putative ABC transport system permease protein
MSFFDSLRHRLRVLLHPGSYQRELDEETRFHLSHEAMQQETDARGGLTAEAARLAALRRYGNVTGFNEERRRMAGLGFFDMARQDLRFAFRSFVRTPGFTAVAVLTLAIGIGGTTAIFSAVNALLLRPLPFREPDRLMMVSLITPAGDSHRPSSDGMVWSYPKFTVFRDAQTSFADLSLTTEFHATISGDGEAERVGVEYVGGRYLPTLGVQPALGRNFLPEEDRKFGGPKVALLGDAFWKRRYNADPSVVGKTLRVSGEPFTIVGILPPGFRGISGRLELMLPVMSTSAEELGQAWSHSFYLVARLKPGVTSSQAMTEAKLLGARVDAAYPNPEQKNLHWGANAKPLDATRVDPVVRRSLLVLLGAVVLVLMIACANVANLFLVRASGRRREIAVRLAVGAGRRRLIRQLLTESVLVSVIGGVASLAVAWSGVRILSTINPASALRTQRLDGLGVVDFSSIQLDVAAFGFAALVTLVTGLVFGLIPALASTRPSLTGELKEGSAAPSGRLLRSFNGRSVLAGVEIALALVLLAGSGLMLRSLNQLLRVDAGFNPDRVLTLRLNTPPELGRDSLPGFYDEMLERLAGIPGVTSVSLADCPPLSGGCSGTAIALRDRPTPAPGSEPSIGVYWVTPQWATALGVPLIRGRMFTNADRLGVQKVVVVNEAAAKAFWPGQDPIGKPVSVGQGGFWNDTAHVVGVVGNVRFGTIDAEAVPDAFLSYYQSPRPRMMVFLRTSGDPLGVAVPARRIIRELAPDAPVYDIRTLESRTGDSLSYARFSTLLLVLFGVVALALATMGTYGVVSFAAAQRTREIGIRIALGATRGSVTRLVVGHGLGIAVVGAVVGLIAALGATRVLRSLLYNVAPSDPATFVGIGAMLVIAVAAASWIPARRATRIEPTEALREG